MDTLNLQDLKRYNISGLRAICSHNRDILSCYHRIPRKELEKRIITILDNNHSIFVPCCISNTDDYFLRDPKKK